MKIYNSSFCGILNKSCNALQSQTPFIVNSKIKEVRCMPNYHITYHFDLLFLTTDKLHLHTFKEEIIVFQHTNYCQMSVSMFSLCNLDWILLLLKIMLL